MNDIQARDNNSAPALYVDGFTGISLANGVVKLNMHADHFNSSTDAIERHIITRLVMPVAVLVSLSQGLQQLVEQMKKDGAIQVEK